MHEIELLDIHLDALHAVPSFVSIDKAKPRPTRIVPLAPYPPKLRPVTVDNVHPEDGPLVNPPKLLTIGAWRVKAAVKLPENPQKKP